MVERLVRKISIEEDLQTKIKEALEHNHQLYFNWCDLSDKAKNKIKFKLTSAYDMGWQKILYGRRYDSSSRHAFIVGVRIKEIIGMVIYSKAC